VRSFTGPGTTWPPGCTLTRRSHMTKTLAVQFGRHGITVNCIHPGTTRTERTPSLLAARAAQLGVSPEEAERQDFAPDSPRGNAINKRAGAEDKLVLNAGKKVAPN
jgi:NAD(P)-dependent dehydrogenase (short-subunit alcohol dehydrogenase family)